MTDIERLRALFSLDELAGTLRWKVRPKRGPVKVGDVAGSLNSGGYLQVMVNKKQFQIHRIVFALVNGYWPDQVDHINGQRSDNRPANLRAATHAENQHNSGKPAHNSSGVKGVTWNKRQGKWRSYCKSNGRLHHLGSFDDIDEAAAAVRAFRDRHHGEFARHVDARQEFQ